MPSILNSDDGAVSGTSGLKSTGGNDGLLNIQSNGSTVVAVTGSGIAVTGTMSQTGASTFAAGTAGAPSITFTGDTNTGIFSPAADTIAFSEGGAEAARLDSSGRMLVGLSSAVTSWGSGVAQQIQSTASGVAYPGFSSYSFTNSAGAGGMINLGHSRSATVGTMTATQDNDVLGYLIFEGVNSSNALTGGAYIQVSQTGAAGASYIPGSMHFFTSNSTTGNAERARFNSTGALVFAGGTTTADGIGITFPATQSASSNANTLDDYEEGTWTPTDASGAGLTFTDVSGNYTKIGRMVFAQFALRYPSTANASNSLIGGMPFAPATGDSARQGFVSYTDESTLALILPEGGPATTAAPRNSGGAQLTNATLSSNYIWAELVYFV